MPVIRFSHSLCVGASRARSRTASTLKEKLKSMSTARSHLKVDTSPKIDTNDILAHRRLRFRAGGILTKKKQETSSPERPGEVSGIRCARKPNVAPASAPPRQRSPAARSARTPAARVAPPGRSCSQRNVQMSDVWFLSSAR